MAKTSFQQFLIEDGLQKGLDVSWYANEENSTAMLIIKQALEEGIDLSQYQDLDLEVWQKAFYGICIKNHINIPLEHIRQFDEKQVLG